MPPVWKVRGKGQLVRATKPDESAVASPLDETPEIHLPVGVVTLVLEKLGGDATTLCSAACVSSTWHAAAKTASVWRIISMGGLRGRGAATPLALRLDGKTFARLASLASPSLTFLELSGAMKLEDADLLCLRLPACPSLKYVSIEGVSATFLSSQPRMKITGRGVLEALKGRKLKRLEVINLFARSGKDMDKAALLKQLRALVRKESDWDVQCICEECDRLITHSMVRQCINDCPETWCAACDMELGHALLGPLCEDCAFSGIGHDDDDSGASEDEFPYYD